MSCKVLRDANTGISRGVGFVQLSTPEEATKAINEMNTKLVCPLLLSRPFHLDAHSCKSNCLEIHGLQLECLCCSDAFNILTAAVAHTLS